MRLKRFRNDSDSLKIRNPVHKIVLHKNYCYMKRYTKIWPWTFLNSFSTLSTNLSEHYFLIWKKSRRWVFWNLTSEIRKISINVENDTIIVNKSRNSKIMIWKIRYTKIWPWTFLNSFSTLSTNLSEHYFLIWEKSWSWVFWNLTSEIRKISIMSKMIQ